MGTLDRQPIITRFLANLAKAGASSGGKVVGTAVGGVAGGPVGAVIGALGGAIIDDFITRWRDKPDIQARLTEIRARNAAEDLQGLKKLLLEAAGVVDDRTDLDRLAAVVDSSDRAPDEPLLREAVEKLFDRHGRTTDEPEELGRAIQVNQQVLNSPGATTIGIIHAGRDVNLYMGNAGQLTDTPEKAGDEPAFRTSTSKLPLVGGHFVGRDQRMAELDGAWADGDLNILSLVADGGVGKTALIVHWLNRFAQNGFRGAERVFAWSFYSQGISDQTATAETFINAALGWFDPDSPIPTSAWDRGVRLAELVQKHRTLLILDGLEPMQHPEEQLDGRLREQSLQALVRELARHNPGLLLISTRLKIADLHAFQGTTAHRIDLEMLSPAACVELFDQLGVDGSADEKKEAAEHFNHHALSIQLLGNFLAKRYDDHDIRHWKEVSLLSADEWDQNHATKVMQSYEKWFAEENHRAELAYIWLIGLFNRPASGAEIDALLAEPSIDGLTDLLTGLTEADRRLALKHLREAGLLLAKDEHAPGTLDAHPLVREHFGERLRKEAEDAWKAGHGRLFDYLTGPGCGKEYPDTLEEMAPLYAAIPHACKAGQQQEALLDVFNQRIRRGIEALSWTKLGAFGSDLAALASFFDEPWTQPSHNFNKPKHAWLLNEVAFCLRASGRFGESEVPTRAGLEAALSLAKAEETIPEHRWTQAAISAGNRSELLLALGRIGEAIEFAEQSVELADQSGNEFERISKRTRLADTLHQAGRSDEARRLFENAEDMQRKWQEQPPLLFSLRGYQYCDLLLAEAERARELDAIRSSVADVRQRASTALEWARREGMLVNIALDHLSIGRAMLLEYLNGGEVRFAEAAARNDTAVDRLREAAAMEFIPKGLLARAALYRVAVERLGDSSSIADAERDLDEVIDIATRDAANGGTLKLFLCDAHLEYARLRLAEGRPDDARPYFETAEALVNECGYHRRDREIDDLRNRLG